MYTRKMVTYLPETTMTIRTRTTKNGDKVYYAFIRGKKVPNGQIERSLRIVKDGSKAHKEAAKRAAQKIQEEYEAKLLAAEYDDDLQKDMDFELFCKKWIDQRRKDVERHELRPNSLRYYEDIMRSIIPYFHKYRTTIRTIRKRDIEAFKEAELDKGKSRKQTRRKLAVIGQVLTYAMENDYILSNPMDRIKLPKKEDKKEVNWYDKDQLNELIAKARGTELEQLVILCGYLGLRREEAAGLKWSDVDFETGYIIIRHVVTQQGRTVIDEECTKSRNGKRPIKINEDLKLYLIDLKKQQQADKKLCGTSYIDSDYIYRRKDGSRIKPNSMTKAFINFIKRNNMPPITLHGLRHSFNTSLEYAGATVSTRAQALGDHVLTVSTYDHAKGHDADKYVLKHQDALKITE